MKYNTKGKKITAQEAWSNRVKLGFSSRDWLMSIAKDEKIDYFTRRWANLTIKAHDNPPLCHYY